MSPVSTTRFCLFIYFPSLEHWVDVSLSAMHMGQFYPWEASQLYVQYSIIWVFEWYLKPTSVGFQVK